MLFRKSKELWPMGRHKLELKDNINVLYKGKVSGRGSNSRKAGYNLVEG